MALDTNLKQASKAAVAIKNSFFRKMLAIVLLTTLLSAVLTALLFSYFGQASFAKMKAREMYPRAKYIAEISSDYLLGVMSAKSYARAIGSGYELWDCSVYVFNYQGELVAYPSYDQHEEKEAMFAGHLSQVLAGERILSTNSRRMRDVMIGEPVEDEQGNVIGAVFLLKPVAEVQTALNGLTVTLVVSMLAVTALMLLPAYYSTRQLTKPLYQMNDVATAMASGDFTVRAYAEGHSEIAQLGRSLNHLSQALSSTIGDLTLERNRLFAVLNGLREGIVAVGPDGVVLQNNPAALALLGAAEGEDSVQALPAYRGMEDPLAEVLSGKREHALREIRVRDATLRCTVTALGESEGAVMMIQDVTEAVRLEQTRRDYVANVSHELRTPLASIRSLADALNDGMIKKEADRSRYYGYILHESIRLSRLIDDLLELSRLQSGNVALVKQSMSLGELVADVADRYEAGAKEKGLLLRIELPDPCGRVFSNPDRAEQVLIALLDNAIKHADGPGEIRVRVTEEAELCRISVQNPGSIPEEAVGHLFERFYKVDQSHSGEGTGLGLSIAAEVMQLLGERIWAESREGVVTFSFTLHKGEME